MRIEAMGTKPSYQELAEAIAYCVHARMYQPEPYKNRQKMTVDTACSSDFQIPAGVLTRLEILKHLDEIHRRHDFSCLPDEFPDRIAQHKEKGCSYDTLVLSLICLLELYPNQQDVHDYLVRLGVCRPVDEGEEAEPPPPPDPRVAGTNWQVLMADRQRNYQRWQHDRIKWTDKKGSYDKLRLRWVELLESSSHGDPCL